MDDDFTYFGLWSEQKVRLCNELLKALGVQFYTATQIETKERLAAWLAWDATAANPNLGFHLWIHDKDVAKVGDRLVNLFPERKFENA